MSLSTGKNEAPTCQVQQTLHQLGEQSYFRNLPRELMKGLAYLASRLNYPDGQFLARQGTPADEAFFILEGEVAVVRDQEHGQCKLGMLPAGRMVGGLALCGEVRWLFGLQAVGSVSCLVLNKKKFQAQLGHDPHAMAQFMAAAVREVHEWEARHLEDESCPPNLVSAGVSLV